ncbi:ATP-binding protein, partial [bacterium]|nr:ATP-binding protein [bacterium]
MSKKISIHKLFLIFLIGVFAIFGGSIVYFSLVAVNTSIYESQQRTVQFELKSYSDWLESYIDARTSALEDLSSFPFVANAVMNPTSNMSAMHDYFRYHKILGEFHKISILDIEGEVLYSTLQSPSFDYHHQKFIQQIIDEEITNYSELVRFKEEIFLRLAVPISYRKHAEGVLLLEIPFVSIPLAENLENDASHNHTLSLGSEDQKLLEIGRSPKNYLEISQFFPKLQLKLFYKIDLRKSKELINELFFDLVIMLFMVTFIFFVIFAFVGDKLFVQPQVQLQLLTDELQLATKKAIDASQSKSVFLANMSHEIRTPLNGIIGFCKLLLTMTLNKEAFEYVKVIKSSGDSLSEILNHILDFSKIEAGKLELENMPFNIHKMIDSSIQNFLPIAKQSNNSLQFHISPNVPKYLQGDPLRLRQIFTNLISNALKFTSDGLVLVSLALKEDFGDHQVILEAKVSDTGVGISAENQKRLFEAFEKTDYSSDEVLGGTGLGLSICTKLLDLMGGKISIESEIGEGST